MFECSAAVSPRKRKGDAKMRELINQYKLEAKRLEDYQRVLTDKIAKEKSPQLILRLEARRLVVETERYEIMRDIIDMEKLLG